VSGYSGLARTFRSSGLSRPTAARRAFQPIKNTFSPAFGARFASDVRDGKIHQVIGAVVDGMETPQAKAIMRMSKLIHAGEIYFG